jgi:CheY-like chemotaxis protein
MPVMDGLTSTNEIINFERENSLSSSCIIALTGVASAAMQDQAFFVEIDDYSLRPVSLRKLRKTMNME